MRNIFKYNLLGLALIMAGITACDTADQDVSPVVSPDNYPVATYAAGSSATTLKEGDTLVYTITTDKKIDRALTFNARIISGTANEDDFEIEPAVIQPYTRETKMYIIVTGDNFPELGESVQIELGVFGIADRYILNPSQVNPTLDLTIENVNDPDVLTIAFGWTNDDDDIDAFAYLGDEDWGLAATSANPETVTAIWPSDPNGTYYFGIDPYIVHTPTIDYTISIGYPDGKVEFFTGTFDTTALESYTVDTFDAWDEYPTYRLLTIVNTDGVFTITHNN